LWRRATPTGTGEAQELMGEHLRNNEWQRATDGKQAGRPARQDRGLRECDSRREHDKMHIATLKPCTITHLSVVTDETTSGGWIVALILALILSVRRPDDIVL
jgi:hypothetical protein